MDNYQNKTDEELVNETLNISNRALTEMMRRLKNSIEKFDKNATRLNKFLAAITMILLVVAIMQLTVSIFLSGINPWMAVIIEVVIFIPILYFANKIFHDFSVK